MSGAMLSRKLMDRSLFRMLLGAVAFLACLAPLALMRPQQAPAVASDSGSAAARLPMVLLTEDEEVLQAESPALLSWMQMAAPERLVRPDYLVGFSRFGHPFFRPQEPQVLSRSIPVQTPVRQPVPDTQVPIVTLGLDAQIHRLWNRQAQLDLPDRATPPPPVGVFWFLGGEHGGQPLQQAPQLDEDEYRQAWQAWQADDNKKVELLEVTLLEVMQNSMLAVPRIVVRQSCGRPAFDQLAVSTVRRALLAADTELSVAGGSAPDYCLIVDWRLSSLKEMPKP